MECIIFFIKYYRVYNICLVRVIDVGDIIVKMIDKNFCVYGCFCGGKGEIDNE